jgi:hypothetical protein
MAERPLLNLPAPEATVPRKLGGGGAKIFRPTRDRQRERLDPRFERLSRVANNPAALLALRDDPGSIAPERAIVFEVEGSLEDFYSQVNALGLEYLGDFESEIPPSDDFRSEKHPERPLASRVYLAMPDARALRELLGLWNRYKSGQRMPNGRGPWSDLFNRLVDVRPWGPQDRVPEETILYFEEDLAARPDTPVRFEVELWFHRNEARRAAAFGRVRDFIESSEGRVIDRATIPEIYYDALLVDLPPEAIRELIDHPDVGLARIDDIMFLRPQSVARAPHSDVEGEDLALPTRPPMAGRPPIAALLDGLPIENHAQLAGHLLVDDPEGLADRYPVSFRRHGTEMASLIVNGDLNHGEPPLSRPLYVRPILQPSAGGERTSDTRLLVDILHEAVLRMKAGVGGAPPSAPDVVVVNLSIGDEHRPFARVMSPLARLIDHLSWQYKLLFLVSAGNITDRLKIEGYSTWRDFEAATPIEREKAVFASLNAQKSFRTILSPAEAANALTIGAAHSGSAFTGVLPADRLDPFTDEGAPNIVSALGLGYRKSIKPELLLSGGRAPVMMAATGGELWVRPPQAGARLFGLKAASANPAGSTSFVDHTWGTSAATALATRAAHRIFESLAGDSGDTNHDDLPADALALVLKALLVHGAQWSACGEMLDGYFQPQGQGSHLHRRDDITRLMGYGVPDISRVLDCTANRATLLGVGTITPGEANLYRIPLPEGLDGVRALRSLVITVAWTSPINPRHQGYRMAAIDISTPSEDKWWMASDRFSYQPTDKAVVRGTTLHERRTDEAATVFVDDGHILLRVGCKASAGELSADVPYAIALSFEVAAELGIPVYDQVKARVEALEVPQPVPVRPGR